jgi:alkylation response protein AidB-like acyl-CoA dehydrogenase
MTTLVSGSSTDSGSVAGFDGLLGRLAELAPLITENGVVGERDRRVAEGSIEALAGAGAFRVAQPRRFGGYGASVRAMLDASAAVGEADGGTAWVVSLCNVSAWLVGLFEGRAQEDVWGVDSGARVCSVLADTADAVVVDGGVRVTGRWFYCSGSWHVDWAVLGIPTVDEHGVKVDRGMALIPCEDLGVEDTWFVAGMKSSGSVCLVAEDVFVPAHRIVSLSSAIAGSLGGEGVESLYRSAFAPTVALVLVGPQLGLCRKALALVRGKAGSKGIAQTSYAVQSDSVAFQMQLAEASMMVDTAHLHAYRAADDIDNAARRGVDVDGVVRARIRADAAWALQHAAKAIDLLLYASGASSFAETNLLQRIWRDSGVASRHAMTLPAVNYEIFGKALLGRDDQITSLI